jgi:hypothetical protein
MFSFFKDILTALTETKSMEVNPANGLPMIEDTQIDVAGNFFGFSNDSFNDHSHSSFDNFSSFND